jgi:hypothetical protein
MWIFLSAARPYVLTETRERSLWPSPRWAAASLGYGVHPAGRGNEYADRNDDADTNAGYSPAKPTAPRSPHGGGY